MTSRGARLVRAARSREVRFGVVLFAVAFALRLAAALRFSREAVWDGHYYDFGARRIAAGFGYSDDRLVGGHLVWHPWCHYPVGYSAFLAFFYRLFGATESVAAFANALTGATLAIATWGFAREGLTDRRARVAGAIVALHPGLILYSALVMSEPLAALVSLLSFWLVLRFRTRAGFAAGSVVLGLAALVRPQALLCAPFFGLVSGGARQRAVAAVAACTIALVTVFPWTLRNCRVMDGCALVSTNGGWNLAIGAFPRATGRFETLRSSDGCADVTGQVQQDRCWLEYGLAQIRERPGRWLSLVPAKLGFTFDHESFAVEYLHEASPDEWPEPTRVWARAATTFVHRLLIAGAAFGAVAFPLQRSRTGSIAQGALLAATLLLAAVGATREPPAFWPLAVLAAVGPWLRLPGAPESGPALRLGTSLLLTTIVTHALFFGEDRYHVVTIPILAVLATAALRPAASRVTMSAA
jgi:4-amino-4-deoxy-L-arabinose transferase-like glycosyltransferase